MGGRIASAATWTFLLAFGVTVGVRASAGPEDFATARIEGQVTRAGWPERAQVEVTRLFDLQSQLGGIETIEVLDRFLAGAEAWSPVAVVTSDEQGRYAVEGLGPGVYDAVAIAADGSSDWTGRTVPGPGAHVEAPLALPASVRVVRGLATYASGRPFDGEVSWTPAWTRQEYENCAHRARRVAVGADGRFVLRGMGVDDHEVVAVLPGRFRVRMPVPTDRDEIRFVVDEAFVPLRVRVVDAEEGKPIPDVALFAGGRASSGRAALVRGVTDAGGRCSLRALTGADAGVSAIRSGYVESSVDSLLDVEGEIVLRMSRGARLSGKVLGAQDGAPIAGATVSVLRPTGGIEWPLGRGRTDAQGLYEISGVPPGEVVVFAESEGSGSAGPVALRAHRAPPVDVRLVPARRVGGRVHDSEGKPLPGAVVRALAHGRRRHPKIFAELPNVLATAVVRRDGAFAFRAVPPDRIDRFEVRAAGHPPFALWTEPTETGDFAVDFRLPPVRRVRMLVLAAATGTPLRGVAVEVLVWTHDWSQEWRGTTDSEGRATSAPMGRGAHRIGAAMEGYAVTGIGSAPEADLPSEVTLRLSRGEPLMGQVLLPDGTPASDIEVLYSFHLPEGYRAVSKTTADGSGVFVFHDLPRADGELWVDTKHEGVAVTGRVPARAGDRDVRVPLEIK